MYVVIETNSWGYDEGAYLFETFKEAFDHLAERFNPVFEDWEEDKMNKSCNVDKPLTDEDRKNYEEAEEDDQLAFWCKDNAKIWSNGILLELYKIQNR